MPPQRSWKEAIVAVLQDAQEPLSAADIVQEIVKRGLKTDFGATPAATVGAQIYISIKSDGAASPFARPVPGRFVLREQQQTLESSTASKDLSEKGPQEGTSQISGVVNALGMFWERSKVDWKISQTRLFGHQPSGIDVDFNAQRGIYLLHDAQGVVYVGRVTDQPLGMRLRQHTIDRLNGRWDRFSWFGVYPVAENGTLRTDADFSMTSINSVIAAMEAVLIEALEPRLNRKRGDTSFDPIEFLQSEDPKMELKRKLEIIEELTAKMKGS
jgi:hypothetical protein